MHLYTLHQALNTIIILHDRGRYVILSICWYVCPSHQRWIHGGEVSCRCAMCIVYRRTCQATRQAHRIECNHEYTSQGTFCLNSGPCSTSLCDVACYILVSLFTHVPQVLGMFNSLGRYLTMTCFRCVVEGFRLLRSQFSISATLSFVTRVCSFCISLHDGHACPDVYVVNPLSRWIHPILGMSISDRLSRRWQVLSSLLN